LKCNAEVVFLDIARQVAQKMAAACNSNIAAALGMFVFCKLCQNVREKNKSFEFWEHSTLVSTFSC
jgi:hypothetical protein